MQLSEHEKLVAAHYDDFTQSFYLDQWDDEDIHFGIFPDHFEMTPEAFKDSLKKMTRAVVEPCHIQEGAVVVDAGCGVGGPALDVAQWYGCFVTGVSISQTQLELARERAKEHQLERVARFEFADCSSYLPFAADSVDVVFAIQSACHFSDRQQFLNECYRILKPGGTLALSDWMATEGISSEAYADYIKPACEAWVLADLETRRSYGGLLKNAGFQVEDFYDFGTAVLENGRILNTLYLNILFQEAAGNTMSSKTVMWKEQLKTLSKAWLKRHFTIENCTAKKP